MSITEKLEKIIKKQITITLGLLLLSSLLFILLPQIDLSVSGLFFKQQQFMHNASFDFIRTLETWILKVMGVILLLCLIWGCARKQKQLVLGSLFITCVFLLGPGVLVNGILKQHSGRPRPRATTVFQGALPFKRPWQFSHECPSNCSFVGGESSTAFAFFAFVFLCRRRPNQWLCGIAAGAYFVLISFIRLAMGGHYLSDIVIGALLVYAVILACYQCFLVWLPKTWIATLRSQ